MYNEGYLKHYGVLGMHWGRRTRNGIMKRQATSSRQISADKEGLRRLANGEHASYGLNAKRQAKYDERDKKYLEGRIKATKSAQRAKEAKEEFKKANSALMGWASRKTSDISGDAQKIENAKQAAVKYVDARIQARKDRQATVKGGERAERSGYIRALSKYGLPNSVSDQQSGGMATALVKNIESKKGKAYTDSIIKSTQHRVVGASVAALAVSGAIIVTSLLQDG